MRVVIDTNVIVGAAFQPGSASGRIVQSVRDGEIDMPWSDETRGEIEAVVRKIPPISKQGVGDLFDPEHRVDPAPSEEGLDWIPDPTDRKFAAVARTAGAVLVSNDRHLLEGRAEAGFEVLSSSEFSP